jgi:predicted dehydrogenase
MAEALRWGIMGTGNIARQFAAGVQGARRSVLTAVGSRRGDSAAAFAQKFGINPVHAHGSYEALLADGAVEAIYLSLPNAMHHEWTLKALAAGKHVLCEKPMAVTQTQGREMFDAATKHGRVLVEAFMYRSHPMTQRIVAQVRDGSIGQVKLIRSSFCFNMNQWRGNIRFDPALAGGGLMDVGCYCVNFARLIAGCEPTGIQVAAHLHASGVDDYAAGVLRFPNEVIASFTCGMTTQIDNTTYISGDGGFITIPVPWKPPHPGAMFTMQGMPSAQSDLGARKPMEKQVVACDAEAPLYALEADDFAATVRDGAAPAVSMPDTLGNLRVLDELRRQAGLPY